MGVNGNAVPVMSLSTYRGHCRPLCVKTLQSGGYLSVVPFLHLREEKKNSTRAFYTFKYLLPDCFRLKLLIFCIVKEIPMNMCERISKGVCEECQVTLSPVKTTRGIML